MSSGLLYSHLGIQSTSPQEAVTKHMAEGARLYRLGKAAEGAKHYEAAHQLTGRSGKRDKASFDNVKHMSGAKVTMGAAGGDNELVSRLNDLIKDGQTHEAARMLSQRKGLDLTEAMARISKRHHEIHGAPLKIEEELKRSANPMAEEIIQEIEKTAKDHVPSVYAILHRNFPNMTQEELKKLGRYLHTRFPAPKKEGEK